MIISAVKATELAVAPSKVLINRLSLNASNAQAPNGMSRELFSLLKLELLG
jgi:hypothetical protein